MQEGQDQTRENLYGLLKLEEEVAARQGLWSEEPLGSFPVTKTLGDVGNGPSLSKGTWGLRVPSTDSMNPSSHGQGGTKKR